MKDFLRVKFTRTLDKRSPLQDWWWLCVQCRTTTKKGHYFWGDD